MDIIVTIPKSEKKNIELEDQFSKKYNNKVLQYWSVSRAPKNLIIGNRVYFIQDGNINYYHEFLGIKKDIRCEVTGRLWPGINLILKCPPVYLKKSVSMQGFQGFRYTEKTFL